ncbi:uncharacterized protein LOC129989052 [Argiope bruennichi]|uniref:uncharacterized protein LOC129989052 n=1 Tax=Argiope bruennichi TaxID=94029 RepID=UPI0024959225|nr:uncharacterized protein LOC129989052 [Argiope bruennichi]
MQSSVTFLFVLSLVVAALAEDDRPRRGPRENPINLMFPACTPFADAIEENAKTLSKGNMIGPRACKEENPDDCIKSDSLKVRCSVEETPSEECIAQLTAFLLGDTCNE